jgi:hypothetical protein
MFQVPTQRRKLFEVLDTPPLHIADLPPSVSSSVSSSFSEATPPLIIEEGPSGLTAAERDCLADEALARVLQEEEYYYENQSKSAFYENELDDEEDLSGDDDDEDAEIMVKETYVGRMKTRSRGGMKTRSSTRQQQEEAPQGGDVEGCFYSLSSEGYEVSEEEEDESEEEEEDDNHEEEEKVDNQDDLGEGGEEEDGNDDDLDDGGQEDGNHDDLDDDSEEEEKWQTILPEALQGDVFNRSLQDSSYDIMNHYISVPEEVKERVRKNKDTRVLQCLREAGVLHASSSSSSPLRSSSSSNSFS